MYDAMAPDTIMRIVGTMPTILMMVSGAIGCQDVEVPWSATIVRVLMLAGKAIGMKSNAQVIYQKDWNEIECAGDLPEGLEWFCASMRDQNDVLQRLSCYSANMADCILSGGLPGIPEGWVVCLCSGDLCNGGDLGTF
ncbi:unnamed protein product [Darwinula stevensoni]|uniref:Uncharacterized protein n=1 Tax=Darwinula stevensoni TaxID=69355 RepID=A0A7R8ZYL4_9CRUS|nr:unnamed protein product [Darwinula stevensoni]CAG0880767.1 unnamed protein product [Darwinula stevensoni]